MIEMPTRNIAALTTEVNHRDDDSVAFLTSMPSIENYFHIDLINGFFDLSLSKADIESSQNDVIKAAVMAVKQKPKKDAIRQEDSWLGVI